MVNDRYLLDSNVFIASSRSFYAIDIAPSFWSKMEELLKTDNVIIINYVHLELTKGKDFLNNLMKSVIPLNVKDDEKIIQAYADVIGYINECGYYSRAGIKTWAEETTADPWLIAAAKVYEGIIISFEQKAGNLSRGCNSGKIKLPDVAQAFQIRYENLYFFMREFGIQW